MKPRAGSSWFNYIAYIADVISRNNFREGSMMLNPGGFETCIITALSIQHACMICNLKHRIHASVLITVVSQLFVSSCCHSPVHLPQVVVSVHVVRGVSDGGQEVALRLLSSCHERSQVVMGTCISWPQPAE
jgi:hypothetical protein